MESETRVCPECGEAAGQQPFCANCGLNMSSQSRLPTRGEWQEGEQEEERHPSAPESASSGPERPVRVPVPRAGAVKDKGVGDGIVAVGLVLGVLSLFFGLFAAIPAVVAAIFVISRGRRLAGALMITVPVLLALFFFGALGGHRWRMPSESMESTMSVGDLFISTRVSEPKRGDIVVFRPPAGADESACGVQHPEDAICTRATTGTSNTTFIKRVAALGGDRVAIRRGRTYIDGEPQEEPYVRADSGCSICNLPREMRIPEGHYLLLGDNRGQSADSREWGPVPKDAIKGKVRLRYWPMSGLGAP